jgi:hypothetical protein
MVDDRLVEIGTRGVRQSMGAAKQLACPVDPKGIVVGRIAIKALQRIVVLEVAQTAVQL